MIGELAAKVRGTDTVSLVAVLTIPPLFLRLEGWQEPFVIALVVAGLVHQPLLRRGELWLTIGVLRIAGLGPTRWFQTGNEEYLITWWCLALGVGLLMRDPDRAVNVAAGWILGLVFAVATFWKLASPDFPDGTYFTFAIVTDGRLSAVAHAAGLGEAELVGNRSALLSMLQPGGAQSFSLLGADAVRPVAWLMSIGTIVLEGLVAVAVLARRWFPSSLRTVVIAVFVVVAYAVAPIVGFGWIVLVLAIAQTRPDEHAARITFVALFIALPVLAHVATLDEAAIPTLAAIVAVGLFAVYMHGAPVIVRDGAVVVAALALGMLLEVGGGLDRATLFGTATGTLVVTVLRLLGARRIG